MGVNMGMQKILTSFLGPMLPRIPGSDTIIALYQTLIE